MFTNFLSRKQSTRGDRSWGMRLLHACCKRNGARASFQDDSLRTQVLLMLSNSENSNSEIMLQTDSTLEICAQSFNSLGMADLHHK